MFFNMFIKFFVSFLSLFYQEKILVIGDSEAVAVSHFFSSVQQQREVVDKEAKGGTSIQQWFGDRLDTALAKHKDSDTIVIFLGTNNIGRSTELDTSPLLNKIKDKKCIWVGPPAVNGHKWKFNQLLRDNVLKNSNCKYLNSEDLKLKLPDGYHPDGQSCILWLQEVWKIKNE
jgi:hypothetical protein